MRLLAALGLIALLLGMPTLAGAQAAMPVAASPTTASGDFAGLVDIGGRSLYLECRGQGSPPVILVAGYRDRGDPWSTDLLQPDSGRTMVRPGVAAFTRVCAYDRPGTVLDENTFSRSDPVPQPRTIAAVVADLHALLAAAGEPGPYVLVGHSLGGLMVRLYAATYPNEVAGLVLVDPSVEGQEARFRAVLTPEQAAALASLQDAAAAGDPAIERYGPEGSGVAATSSRCSSANTRSSASQGNPGGRRPGGMSLPIGTPWVTRTIGVPASGRAATAARTSSPASSTPMPSGP